MERTSLLLIATLFVTACGDAATAADNSKAYPFKSAIITYRISGSIQHGTQTLYIDDYGKKTRTERETTMNIPGIKRKDSTIEIDDGHYHYRIDPMRKTGEKTPSFSKVAEEILKTMSADQKKEMEELGKELVKGLTGKEEMKPAGKETILGKECAVYDLMGVKSWLWNNLALKIENPSLGNMVQEAVELKIDVPIAPDTFSAPPDITLIEVSGKPSAIQSPAR